MTNWILMIALALGGSSIIPMQNKTACVKAAKAIAKPNGAGAFISCINTETGDTIVIPSPKIKMEMPTVPLLERPRSPSR